MKVYAGMDPRLPLGEVAAHARRVEAMGYDGLQVSETVHDALALSLLVAEHTERITIRTSVALAFVRSPTLTAYAAWDLARFSGGRFELGLGTQIRQNIEDRYGMPWAEPVARMRDYVDVLAAVFETFRTGGPLRHDGPHYRLSRMQPYFNPGPDDSVTPPPIWLGGVNPGMCRLAGEVAAGFVTHPTNANPRYLETVCLPNLRAGAERAGRPPGSIEVVAGTQVISGADEAALESERERQRRLFAFLYSTPAYRPTLDLHGWDDLGDDLRALVREERWDDLGRLVPDDVLDTLVPTATYDRLATVLLDRFDRLVDGLLLSPPPVPDPAGDEALAAVVAAVQDGRR